MQKGILKQSPFAWAVQECRARQNNEPSVHPSPPSFPCFYPLGLNQSSPRMAESLFTSSHPGYILQKTLFWAFFPPLLFCSQEPQQNLSLNLRPLCQVASQLPASALSTDHKCLPQAIHPLFTIPWRQRGTRSPRHPFVQGREYHVNGRPPKIYSPPLFAWCHCLLGLDSKLR